MQKILLTITCIFIVFMTVHSQTTLNLFLNNGIQVNYNVADITRIDFSGVTKIEDFQKVQKILNSFQLHQNFPNPFNPSTTIVYEIPHPGNVTITIIDLNGKVVQQFNQHHSAAGQYQIQWNGRNRDGILLSSGFYLYSVKFGQSIISKKMLMMK